MSIRPTSLENAFTIDSPGEYEVHEVLVTGVRTFRDDAKGNERGLEHLVRVSSSMACTPSTWATSATC